MAIRESQKVTYVDKVGVTSQTGRDTAVRAEARAQAEWNKTMETQSETLGKLANKADELAMKNSIENLQFEQEEYTYTDDDGLETTVKRPKQFKPDRFFWQPSQDAYDKMVVIKMKEDLGRQFEEQSFKVASDSQTRKQTADQFLQRMQPVYDQYMQNVPSRFREYLRPKLDAKLLADQKRVSNTFRVQQEKMMLDSVTEQISSFQNKYDDTIIYNKEAGQEALENLKQIPEEVSGIARPLVAKLQERIKSFDKFYGSSVGGVTIRDLANNITTAGETIEGKRNIVANLSALDELLDNTGDQTIMVDGKPVKLSQAEFNNSIGTLSEGEKTDIQTDVRARLANLTGDADNTGATFSVQEALRQQLKNPRQTVIQYQSDINKLFNKNPTGFIQTMGFQHESVADAFADPQFISAMAKTGIMPEKAKDEIQSLINNGHIPTITAVLDSAMEMPSVQKYIDINDNIQNIPADYQFLPRLDPKVNGLLRAIMVRRIVDQDINFKNVINDLNEATSKISNEDQSTFNEAIKDANKAIKERLNKNFDGLGDQSPAISKYAETLLKNATIYDGVIKTPVASFKNMANKFVDSLEKQQIIGKSRYNYRPSDTGSGYTTYPLENFVITDPNNPTEKISDWHEAAIKTLLDNPDAELGNNVKVFPVQTSRGVLTTNPFDVSYYVLDANGNIQYTEEGNPIIYQPFLIKEELDKAALSDAQSNFVLQEKINHYNVVDKDTQELIRKQEKINQSYSEVFRKALPNYGN